MSTILRLFRSFMFAQAISHGTTIGAAMIIPLPRRAGRPAVRA